MEKLERGFLLLDCKKAEALCLSQKLTANGITFAGLKAYSQDQWRNCLDKITDLSTKEKIITLRLREQKTDIIVE